MFDVGDVVVCVDDAFIHGNHVNQTHLSFIQKNKMYKVLAVYVDRHGSAGIGIEGIKFPFDDVIKGYLASRFRKLPPAEPEFIKLIRSLKAPTKIREDA